MIRRHAARATRSRCAASEGPLRGRMTGALAAAASMLAFALAVGGCMYGEPTAGGSSEVDNPVVLAMVDAQGTPVTVSGSLGLYPSDQSPALNPSPRIEVRLEQADSFVLLPKLVASAQQADSAVTYALHLQGDDSTGALLRDLVYDPRGRRFTREDGTPVSRLNVTVSPLVRVESVLAGADTAGVQRLIIPGSPFQTVLVDSTFVFEALPPGVHPLHLLTAAGEELPLPDPLDTRQPQRLWFNPDTTPVPRPPAPLPPDFSIDAGPDRTVSAGTEINLAVAVTGVSEDDKRLTFLWRQVPPSQASGYATIERPTRASTRVMFPRTGAYTFVATVMLGERQATDTITIGVQASPENPVFIEPGAGDTLRWLHWSRIAWMGTRTENVTLELSRDSGATWSALPMLTATPSRKGFNERFWQPVPLDNDVSEVDTNTFLRMTRDGEVLAQSLRFTVRGY